MIGALRWLGQVVVWLVILGAVGVLAVAVVIPRIAGATPYTIITGSMRPGLPPGTLVVVKPVEPEEIQVGDVITYQLESGEAPVVTHRVTDVVSRLDGTTTFITQGDANDVEDREPVLPVQIRGRVWYSIPVLGRVNDLMTARQRQVAVLGVAGALTTYAAYMFTGAFRDRNRGREEVP